MARRWTVRLAACLVAGPLLLGGCSQKHQASDSLPPTKSAPATKGLAALGPADFPVPAEARTRNAPGAEAFMRYYLELYNHAKDSLNADPLRSLSRDCQMCEQLAQQIDAVSEQGQTYNGGRITVESMSPPLVQDTGTQIAFSVREEPLTVMDKDDHPVPGEVYGERRDPSCGAILKWNSTQSTWVLTQLDIG